MNSRKYLIALLLGALSVILLYNFLLIPLQGSNMSMPISRPTWNSPVFLIDLQCIILIGALLIVLLMFEVIRSRKDNSACKQCGKKIENSRWKVCPVCGTIVNAKVGI